MMSSTNERAQLTRRGSQVGVLTNLLLFCGKFLAGYLSASVAMMADAFNNLSDAGSAIVSLIGFRLSRMPASETHPFGHGRYEYIASLTITVIIGVMGFELLKSSLGRIMSPAELVFHPLAMGILVASVGIKLALAYFYYRIYNKTNSVVFKATCIDSLSDVAATAVVLIGTGLSLAFGWQIDGWLGLLVSGLILFAGYKTLMETLSLLLGQAPDQALIGEISQLVQRYPEVLGVHDVIVHNYGPSMLMISLHVEVDGSLPLMEIHHRIDLIEHALMDEYNGSVVIHIDPIAIGDEAGEAMHREVVAAICAVYPHYGVHDFRAVVETRYTSLYFDVMIPPKDEPQKEAIKASISRLVGALSHEYHPIVHVVCDYGVIPTEEAVIQGLPNCHDGLLDEKM